MSRLAADHPPSRLMRRQDRDGKAETGTGEVKNVAKPGRGKVRMSDLTSSAPVSRKHPLASGAV